MTPEFAADVEHLLDQREAQGLPRIIDDPAAIRRIVAVIRSSAAYGRLREPEAASA